LTLRLVALVAVLQQRGNSFRRSVVQAIQSEQMPSDDRADGEARR